MYASASRYVVLIAFLITGANASWVRDDIDRFVLAGIERAELRPATEADKHTLLRRATFALIGFPRGWSAF